MIRRHPNVSECDGPSYPIIILDDLSFVSSKRWNMFLRLRVADAEQSRREEVSPLPNEKILCQSCGEVVAGMGQDGIGGRFTMKSGCCLPGIDSTWISPRSGGGERDYLLGEGLDVLVRTSKEDESSSPSYIDMHNAVANTIFPPSRMKSHLS